MKNKLEELRELIFKCEEVEKDVLELKFGCEVAISDSYKTNTGKITNYYRKGNGNCVLMNGEEFRRSDIQEIIGRDITLEDVLRAIMKKFKQNYSDKRIEDLIFNGWELGKPLQDQSEECIDSLIKLLK